MLKSLELPREVTSGVEKKIIYGRTGIGEANGVRRKKCLLIALRLMPNS